MAHTVSFSIPSRKLGVSDVEFVVKVNAKRFGTLRISKGSLVWFPKNTRKGHKIGWSKFDELMRAKKRRERR